MSAGTFIIAALLLAVIWYLGKILRLLESINHSLYCSDDDVSSWEHASGLPRSRFPDSSVAQWVRLLADKLTRTGAERINVSLGLHPDGTPKRDAPIEKP